MTDLIVGGGAVGAFLGWALASGGREVAIVRRGLTGGQAPAELVVVDPAGRRRTAHVLEVSAPGELAGPPELILFAVKMYDLAAAVATCSVWPDATVLTIENGIGAEQLAVRERLGGGVIAGSLTTAVEVGGPGEIRRLSHGGVGLAPVRGAVDPLIAELALTFAAAGLRVGRYRNPESMKWSKLLGNLIANATGGLLDLGPAQIYAHPGLFAVEQAQLREAIAVMRRLQQRPVALPGADMRLLALAVSMPAALARPILRRVVSGARGGKDPSLRTHLETGSGPSEVEWLNGAVARAGSQLGVPTPINQRLKELVLEVLADPDRRAWFRGRPDRLLAAMAEGPSAAP